MALLITHPHPDHYNGAALIRAAFPQIEIIATQKTFDGIQSSEGPKRAFWTPIHHEDYPPVTAFPTRIAVSGERLSLAGTDFIFEDLGTGECENISKIFLPEHGILFSSDLIYNEVHPWLAEGTLHGMAWAIDRRAGGSPGRRAGLSRARSGDRFGRFGCHAALYQPVSSPAAHIGRSRGGGGGHEKGILRLPARNAARLQHPRRGEGIGLGNRAKIVAACPRIAWKWGKIFPVKRRAWTRIPPLLHGPVYRLFHWFALG